MKRTCSVFLQNKKYIEIIEENSEKNPLCVLNKIKKYIEIIRENGEKNPFCVLTK